LSVPTVGVDPKEGAGVVGTSTNVGKGEGAYVLEFNSIGGSVGRGVGGGTRLANGGGVDMVGLKVSVTKDGVGGGVLHMSTY
jgi:hypothetical protein